MMNSRDRVVEQLRDALLRDRNADGGWGYLRAKRSRVEPTALAMLAFSTVEPDAARPILQLAAGLLRRWQRADGMIVPQGPPLPNVAFNGLAAVALMHVSTVGSFPAAENPSLGRLLGAVAAAQGNGLPLARRVLEWWSSSPREGGQNGSLRGWPWVNGTFSWVEPTAWCLLALKRARHAGHETTALIEEAEDLLFDRCCRSGGWNYGNATVLGQDLAAYVPTSAIALIALADRRERPEVQRSLAFLRANFLRERSGMALALATIALKSYGVATEAVEALLAERAEGTGFIGNNAVRALAISALDGGPRGHPAFAV